MWIPESFVRLIKWFYDTFMNPLPENDIPEAVEAAAEYEEEKQ